MARKNTQDALQKQHTWKFYTIISSIIAVLLIVCVVASIVVYNVVYSEDYNNKFSEYTEYKINYNELDDLIDSESGRYTIIFAYDDAYMDQGEIDELDSDDPNRNSYIKCNQAFKDLFDVILVNKNAYANDSSQIYNRIDFYVINTSLQGNSDFLSSQEYGNVGLAPSVILLDDEGKNITSFGLKDDDKKNHELTNGKGSYVDLTKDLKELKDLVSSYNPTTGE